MNFEDYNLITKFKILSIYSSKQNLDARSLDLIFKLYPMISIAYTVSYYLRFLIANCKIFNLDKAVPIWNLSFKHKLPKRQNSSEGSMARSVGSQITDKVINECREKLVKTKMDLLNRVKEAREKLDLGEKGGDEADQTMRLLAEQEMLNLNDRLRAQLFEIESALGRIENGTFGFCEETDEPIEIERLRAIPWTRLSIEGAEMRESLNRRYAR